MGELRVGAAKGGWGGELNCSLITWPFFKNRYLLLSVNRKDWEEAIAAKRGSGSHKTKAKKGGAELNNKSSLLAGVQQGLADTGTRRYVDSDSD